jgi:hypothetical protein
MVKSLVVVDVELRGLFLMERAAALILAPGLLELGGLADQTRQQCPGAKFV